MENLTENQIIQPLQAAQLLPAKAKGRIPFYRPNKKGISLKEVIALHLQYQAPNSLKGNIGDGFLYATNPYFKNVRDEYLKRGFSFTTKNIGHYFTLPMMALDDLLQAGSIPYLDNFAWLIALEKRAPGRFTLTEVDVCGPKYNYLFHESAHFIAHSIFFGRKPMHRISKNSDSLLKILIGEAFANSVECMSGIFCPKGIGSYFLFVNCHFRASIADIEMMRQGTKAFGFEAATRIVLAAFLYSNFMYENLGKKEMDLVFKFSGLAKKDPLIMAMAHMGFQLNKQFRSTTTPLHLMKVGFDSNIGKMLSFDPLARLLHRDNAALLRKVHQLTQIV